MAMAMAMAMELCSVFAPRSWTLPLHIRGQERTLIKVLEAPACIYFEKLSFSALRAPGKSCHSFITGGVKTENLCQDATLVDIEERGDGFVLFKFGTLEPYDQPSMFISSVEGGKSIIFPAPGIASEVIDCLASISMLTDENTSVNEWGYTTTSVHEGPSKTVHAACDNRTRPPPQAPTLTTSAKQLGLPVDFISCHEPPSGPGCFSMGIHGSGIIDNDWMDIIVPNSMDFDHGDKMILDCLHGSSPNIVMAKMLPENLCLEDVSTHVKNLGTEAVHTMKSPTIKRADRLRKKGRPQQKKPGKVVTRDLFKSSSFQLYELIFSYPFIDSSKAALTWQTIPKEQYGELLSVLNQIAVGLAGSGLALLLFVASRMLCLNATMDGSKLMFLLQGVGLLWLSSALQKFGSVVRHMADVCGKARLQRKEHLAKFKKEVQAVTLKVCTLVMLSMVRLA